MRGSSRARSWRSVLVPVAAALAAGLLGVTASARGGTARAHVRPASPGRARGVQSAGCYQQQSRRASERSRSSDRSRRCANARRLPQTRALSQRQFVRLQRWSSLTVGRVGSPARHLAGFQPFEQGPLPLGSANRSRGPGHGAAPAKPLPLGGGVSMRVGWRAGSRATVTRSGGSGLAVLQPKVLREIPSFRTEYSDTYVTAQGFYVAKVYSGAVNYQAADGSWQPIDDQLVPSGSGYVNKADAYRATLPGSLGSAPVSFAIGGDSASVRLEGASAAASAAASVSGRTAHYHGVLTGLDASYEALPGVLRNR
jgi:hypothetical protein